MASSSGVHCSSFAMRCRVLSLGTSAPFSIHSIVGADTPVC
jgi:hypothetical protein